eukprot:CAMPEP_0167741332 /NCGR_PEP_ID=MMETSP0110_2-20121227/798_1 /TAXON_ID=629695 /ORGANISM="Gymnochlora sp., Strain CCMP2014" /LENGTH=218 /DNA_ID=CAMNT_0007625373 /DNA_START=65 /DNA_END=721 /DNA_ORIENTATION=+
MGKTLIVSYGFTDLSINWSGQMEERETFCFSEQVTNAPWESFVNDTFTQAIKPRTAYPEVTFMEDQDTWFLYRPETPTPLGVKMKNPDKDKFPENEKDPRIFDADQDGKPGVTVRILIGGSIKGEIYLVRLERFEYEMFRYPNNGTWKGYVTDRSLQMIIGSDPAWLTNRKVGKMGGWVQQKDKEKSYIILVPVDYSYTCKKLKNMRHKLFPATPTKP